MVVALCLVGFGMGSLAIGSEMVMGGAPAEKAGNAGAIQETAYELAATLGVSILGSVSALVYRADLTAYAGFASLEQADPTLAGQAEESLGAAMAIADQLDLPGLVARAGEAFSASLQLSGWVGGAIMLVVAVASFCLAPKSTSPTGAAVDG